MSTLIIIPARKGSKGLPNKNIRKLGDKPLIQHTLEFAQKICTKEDLLCVSTDSDEIINICQELKVRVDFKRPSSLATDNSSMDEVILHALNFYNNFSFNKILLLQPTTPFRSQYDYLEMNKIPLISGKLEQIASVKIIKDNPYFNMFKVDDNGNLEKFFENKMISNRQDSPKVLALNGSIYLFDKESFLKKKSLKSLITKPFIMDNLNSCDIDSIEDFEYAQFLINKKPTTC